MEPTTDPRLNPPLLKHLFDAKPPKDRWDKREEAAGTAISVLVHVLILALLIWVGRDSLLEVAADLGVGDGIGAGAAGGGGGGGSEDFTVVTTVEEAPPPPPAPQPEKVVVEEVPVPVPVPDPVITPPIELKLAPVALTPDTMPVRAVAPTGGTGGGTGPGTGTGTGAGTGPGSGGGSGGGEGGGIGSGIGPGTGKGKLLAPSPEVLLIPPPAPGSVRGKTVVVRLAVDSVGVVKDADIIPSTGDRKYDSALKRVALGWRFKAARNSENRPVPVNFDVTFTF